MTLVNRKIADQIKKMCEAHPDEVLKALLETPFWPNILETGVGYQRYDDDTQMGNIIVMFDPVGDGRIDIISDKDPDERNYMHRFRNDFGGGKSLHTYAALKFLAVAIDMDNAEKLQNRK